MCCHCQVRATPFRFSRSDCTLSASDTLRLQTRRFFIPECFGDTIKNAPPKGCNKKSATKRLRGKDLFNFQLSREYNSQTTARAFAKHPFKRIITESVIISLNYVPVLRIVPSKEPLHVLRVRLEELLHYNREFQARSSESNMIVNGPSLVSEIFMSAPKIPV